MLKVTQKPKPLVLCILDGWGIAQDSPGNAITHADCINFNELWFSFPHALLTTAGQSAGLPDGHVGNSEVGHINLGAGRIVFQDLLRINMSIADGSFYENEAFLKAIAHIGKYGSNIHLLGLVGLGSVHSEVEHLYALLRLIKKEGVPSSRVKIHVFTDGRDSPPTSAKNYLSVLADKLEGADLGQISTICGRFFAMDRDNRWDRTLKVYKALIGESERKDTGVLSTIEKSYTDGKTDEFIEPTIIVDSAQIPVGVICANDAIVFLNYRKDRTRQLTKAFILDDLSSLKTASGEKIKNLQRGKKLDNLFFVTMTRYEKDLPINAVAFQPEAVQMPLVRVFAERNNRQLHIAETEKYAHVTYFFNGGREAPFSGEDRILVDSQKVSSYDKLPQMSAGEITKRLISKINLRVYDFIIVNFANADMVAHTGKFEPTIEAVKSVDYFLGIIAHNVLSVGGGIIITADHGNAEELINLRTGEVDTEHNVNPAPCIFVLKELRGLNAQLPQGILADVAPSILSILKIPRPSQMTGTSLL